MFRPWSYCLLKVKTALEIEGEKLGAGSRNQPALVSPKPKPARDCEDEAIVQRLVAARASKLARAEAEAYADVQVRKTITGLRAFCDMFGHHFVCVQNVEERGGCEKEIIL